MKKYLLGSFAGLLVVFAAIVADGVRRQLQEQAENLDVED
jgi:hypothetical protein